VSIEKYLDLAKSLLPKGQIWNKAPGTNLEKFLKAVVKPFAEIEDHAKPFLDLHPLTTTFINEWKKLSLGKDDCIHLLDQTQQRKEIFRKWLYRDGITVKDLKDIARDLGYFIKLAKPTASQFGVYQFGMPLQTGGNGHLLIRAPKNRTSRPRFGVVRFGDRLGTSSDKVLACVLRKYIPDHLNVSFVFDIELPDPMIKLKAQSELTVKASLIYSPVGVINITSELRDKLIRYAQVTINSVSSAGVTEAEITPKFSAANLNNLIGWFDFSNQFAFSSDGLTNLARPDEPDFNKVDYGDTSYPTWGVITLNQKRLAATNGLNQTYFAEFQNLNNEIHLSMLAKFNSSVADIMSNDYFSLRKNGNKIFLDVYDYAYSGQSFPGIPYDNLIDFKGELYGSSGRSVFKRNKINGTFNTVGTFNSIYGDNFKCSFILDNELHFVTDDGNAFRVLTNDVSYRQTLFAQTNAVVEVPDGIWGVTDNVLYKYDKQLNFVSQMNINTEFNTKVTGKELYKHEELLLIVGGTSVGIYDLTNGSKSVHFDSNTYNLTSFYKFKDLFYFKRIHAPSERQVIGLRRFINSLNYRESWTVFNGAMDSITRYGNVLFRNFNNSVYASSVRNVINNNHGLSNSKTIEVGGELLVYNSSISKRVCKSYQLDLNMDPEIFTLITVILKQNTAKLRVDFNEVDVMHNMDFDFTVDTDEDD
jgi:uncharacterized protein YmfQ (DUF2313 family)